MPEPLKVIERLTSWWRGQPTEKVGHPAGKFDMHVLIDAMCIAEARDHKVSHIVFTSEQLKEFLLEQTDLRLDIGIYGKPGGTLFGAKIEVDDTPQWSVGIIEEVG